MGVGVFLSMVFGDGIDQSSWVLLLIMIVSLGIDQDWWMLLLVTVELWWCWLWLMGVGVVCNEWVLVFMLLFYAGLASVGKLLCDMSVFKISDCGFVGGLIMFIIVIMEF